VVAPHLSVINQVSEQYFVGTVIKGPSHFNLVVNVYIPPPTSDFAPSTT
jgi:hypothetical protein